MSDQRKLRKRNNIILRASSPRVIGSECFTGNASEKLQEQEGGAPGKVAGWAIQWDAIVERFSFFDGKYYLKFDRNAFNRAIADPSSVLLLWQHDSWTPIGRVNELENRREGLYLDGTITNATQHGAEANALVREGIVDAFSIGFSYDRFERNEDPEGLDAPLVTVLEADLQEISLVSFPAAEDSRIVQQSKQFISAEEMSNAKKALDRLLAG